MKIEYIVNTKSKILLKDYLLEIGLSRRFCRKLKLYGKMYINGVESKNYMEVKDGDIVTLEYDEKENDDILPNGSTLDIKYEGEHILIINKQESLSSQPSRLHYEDNVISYVKKYLQDKNIYTNIHLVNRLDYQTSGLMIIAKDGFTHFRLTKEGEKTICRKYLAIIEGTLKEKKGVLDFPIARENETSIKRTVSFTNPSKKDALTEYKVLKEYDDKSLIEVKLHTGRTHQIRVHFSHIGHPLIGDKLYGKENTRLMLHCYYLSFVNPFNNEFIEIIDYPPFKNIY